MSEKLSINSEIFDTMREQFNDILNSLVNLLEPSDEGELNLKLFLHKESIEVKESETKDSLKASWDIIRTIKAKKYKTGGSISEDYIIEADAEGKLCISKVQTSLFDLPDNIRFLK